MLKNPLRSFITFVARTTILFGLALPAFVAIAGPLDKSFVGPLAGWKSVKDFGAKGDGTTDDTAAIQAALDALKAVQTNTWSVLYFPSGTYKITQALTTTRATHHDYLGAQIIGQDPNTTSMIWPARQGASCSSGTHGTTK